MLWYLMSLLVVLAYLGWKRSITRRAVSLARCLIRKGRSELLRCCNIYIHDTRDPSKWVELSFTYEDSPWVPWDSQVVVFIIETSDGDVLKGVGGWPRKLWIEAGGEV